MLTPVEIVDLAALQDLAHPPIALSRYRLTRPPETVETLTGITAWPAAITVTGAILRVEDRPIEDPEDWADLAGRVTAELVYRSGEDIHAGDVVKAPDGSVWLVREPKAAGGALPTWNATLDRVPSRFIPQALRDVEPDGGEPPPAGGATGAFRSPMTVWVADKTAHSVTLACPHTSALAVSYRLYRDGVLVQQDLVPDADDEVVAEESGLASGATHTWTMTAVDAADVESDHSHSVTAVVRAPILVASTAAFQYAMGAPGAPAAEPNDVVRLTADLNFLTDNIYCAPGVIVDGAGHRITIPKVSASSRGLWYYDGGPIRVTRLVQSGSDYALVALKSGTGHRITDVDLVDCKDGIKMDTQDAPGVAENRGIYIRRFRLTGRPGVAGAGINLGGVQGSGIVRDYCLKDVAVRYTGYSGSDTGIDNTALEAADGTGYLERVLLDGAIGDGLDVKNFGPVILRDVVARNCTRQGIKIWGAVGELHEWTRVQQVNCGLNAMISAGIVTLTDCYIEAGILDGAAAYFGSTVAGTGPGYGGVQVTVNNSVFRRIAGTGLLISVPTNITLLNTADFEGCAFWNPGHPSVTTTYGGPDNGDQQTVANALAGTWNTRYTDCRYADEGAPAVAIAPETPRL